MQALTHWFKNSGPIVKTLMAISITSALVVAHRMVYAPHVRRQRYKRAEEWANIILEQEEISEQTGETFSNNIRY